MGAVDQITTGSRSVVQCLFVFFKIAAAAIIVLLFLPGCESQLIKPLLIFSKTLDRSELEQTQTVRFVQPAGRAILVAANGYETEFEILSKDPSGELIGHARISYLRTVPVYQLIEATDREREISLSISSINKTKNSNISLSVSTVELKTSDDDRMLDAYRNYSDAIQYVESEDPEEWAEKVEKLELAARLFNQIGENRNAIWSRFLSAYFDYFPIYNFSSAIDKARAVQEEAREKNFELIELMALQLEGQALSERDESDDMEMANLKLEQAQLVLSEAIQLASDLGLMFEEAWATNFRGLEAQRLILSVYGNIALVNEQLGQYDQSVVAIEKILEKLPSSVLQSERAHFLTELGRIYHKLYMFQHSVFALAEAKNIADRLGSTKAAGKADVPLAWAYFNMGQPTKAKEIVLQAISDLDDADVAGTLHDAYQLLSSIFRNENLFEELDASRALQKRYMLSSIEQDYFELDLAKDQLEKGNDNQAALILEGILARDTVDIPIQLRLVTLFEYCHLQQGEEFRNICSPEKLENHLLELDQLALPRHLLHAKFLLSRIYIHQGEHQNAKLHLNDVVNDISFYRKSLPGILGAWFWNEKQNVIETYLQLLVGTAATEDEIWSALVTLDEFTNVESLENDAESGGHIAPPSRWEMKLRTLLVKRSELTSERDFVSFPARATVLN